MSKFCKITTDKRIMDAPNPLRIVISNPTDERYRYEGWLEKKPSNPPEYDPKTQYVTDYWEEETGFAVQKWEIHDIEVEPEEPENVE